ncbi:MAG: class I SAM-dependent methyltransferase [Candidatus Gracilibacteria bacterium]|nr:class I SAM-dependent methyltransferase [Candidatus Gracilibacteria bacterium]
MDKCFICGGKFLFYMSGKDYNSNVTNKEFTIKKCSSCGVELLSPIPTYNEIVSYYPVNYYSYNIKSRKKGIFDKAIDLGFKNKLFGKFLDRRKMGIPFIIKGKYFLDIGCGDGAILDLLQKQGWNVYGFEIGDKKVAGNIYYDTNFVDVDYGDIKFDFIRISHVFEHLTNPIEFLEKLKLISNSNTIIDITLPNTKSFDAYVFGKYWSNRDVPRHIINYNIDNFELLIKKYGFVILKKRYLLGFGMGGSIINLLKYKYGDSKIYKLFQNKFISLLILFFDFILSFFHLGDHIGFRIKLYNNK